MTEQYPDWVYDEMAKRVNVLRGHQMTADACEHNVLGGHTLCIAFAKLIHETQEAPEDPHLPIARKAAAERLRQSELFDAADKMEAGKFDDHPHVQTALRLIHALLEHQEQQP